MHLVLFFNLVILSSTSQSGTSRYVDLNNKDQTKIDLKHSINHLLNHKTDTETNVSDICKVVSGSLFMHRFLEEDIFTAKKLGRSH